MATDATFERIQSITPHDNADSLEIATVSNFPCVVRKGEFSEGDWTFYVRDDARLTAYDEYVAHGDDRPDEPFVPTHHAWQAPLMRYLGANGRVKTVRLRKRLSMGILLRPEVVLKGTQYETDQPFGQQHADTLNSIIRDEERGVNFLRTVFGIEHWVAPITGCSMGQTDARGPLCPGVWKSDEENFENLDPADLGLVLNTRVLETAKLDGTSTSVYAAPDGDVHVMSRSLDLKLDCDNVYTRATRPIAPLAVALAKHLGQPVCLRGETVGDGINASKANKDARLPLGFYLYATIFPGDPDYDKRIGLYGTPWHFLEVAKLIKSVTGFDIPTVPILGTPVLTLDYLNEVVSRPASLREGSVFNTANRQIPHFKAKSREYLTMVG